MIHCHVGFTILSEQCSQNNLPIIKTKSFKVTNIKKNGVIFFIILSFFLKNKNKYINKTNSVLFSSIIGIISRSIQEIE